MDRAMLLDHLKQAQRHIAEGKEHIAKQREIVAELERDGHDTTEARRLLGNFEDLYQLHLADFDRILNELDEQPKRPAEATRDPGLRHSSKRAGR